MPNLNTREVLENMFNGTTAIKNQNPRFGQKEYYYINPYLDKQSSPTEKDIAYVDSPDDPNPFLQQPGSTSGTVNTTGLTGSSSSLNTTSSLTNNTSSTGGIGSLNNSSMTNNAFTNQSTTGLFGTNTTKPLGTSSTLGTASTNGSTSPFGSSPFGATNNDPFKSSSSLSPLSTTGLSADNAYSNTTNEPSWNNGYGLSQANNRDNVMHGSSITASNDLNSSFFTQLNEDMNDLEQTKTLKYYSTDLKDYDLISRMLPIELKYEDIYPHPYYDSVWIKTGGLGTNIDDKDDFHEINWRAKNGSEATREQEEECLDNLNQRKAEIQASSTNINKNNYKARSFENVCDIRMPRSEVERKYVERMGNSINELRKLFPNFNQMHPERQNALMDMHYNLGLFNFKKYKNCRGGINSNDVDVIKQECRRGSISSDRNNWTINGLIQY